MNLKLLLSLVVLMLLSHLRDVNGVSSRLVPKELRSHRNYKLLNLGESCGRPLFTTRFRIIGGNTAGLGEYPWMARLGYTSFSNVKAQLEMFLCGGSVINVRYVLTAAHCAPEFRGADLILVRVGEHLHKQETEISADCVGRVCAPPARDYNVERIICHQDYTRKSKQHDICLIRVEGPIQFNDYVKPVCLPFYEHLQRPFENEYLNVAGWGRTDPDSDNTSDVLMAVYVPIIDQTVCKDFFAKRQESVKIGHTQICAGGEKGKDSCEGDSGGPLVKTIFIGYDLVYFQLGIVSFGATNCAQTHTPAVYTRVDKYLMWILDHVHE